MADSINRKKNSSSNSQSNTNSASQVKREQSSSEATNKSNSASTTELTDSEQSEIRKLKTRDTEVRAHERAHINAGGNLIQGGASYEYTTGPDNKRYAIGGEVSIDTSPVKNDPEATIQKGQKVKRAALAPAKPSSQDYSVASAAQQMITSAQMELARMNREEMMGEEGDKSDAVPRVMAAQAYQAVGGDSSAGFDMSS